jgi:hypothetical protein
MLQASSVDGLVFDVIFGPDCDRFMARNARLLEETLRAGAMRPPRGAPGFLFVLPHLAALALELPPRFERDYVGHWRRQC